MPETEQREYIHGTDSDEQQRLASLNHLTNASFVDFVKVKDTDHILELGSGLGLLAEMISKKLTSGKLTGIEISNEQLRKCPRKSANLEFIQGDIHALPFEDNTFHIVYCRYVLEHVSDPYRVLAEAMRVLKPGGRIYIQENSVLLLEFSPECPAFTKVWKTFARFQSDIGGDAMIGLKLYEMLKRSGFKEPELTAAPEIHYTEKGSHVAWIDNLIVILQGVRDPLITRSYITASEFSSALQELEDFKRNEYASSYFYWNRASAVK